MFTGILARARHDILAAVSGSCLIPVLVAPSILEVDALNGADGALPQFNIEIINVNFV